MTVTADSASRAGQPASSHWLVGGGAMGKLIRSMDWSQTPLGPIESWPPSLRTTVSLALNSNFPISLAWGPHHTQLYNDGYWPICAAKHPTSMGQDFTECWASAWPAIGEAFASALAGITAFLEDQRMFLDRLGYLEETFFTFSFSPIRDESGQVAGLFHPVTETTSKMVGQRRTRTLRDVAERAAKAQSLDEGLALAAQTLAESDLDLPFVLFYKLDKDGCRVRLAAQAGLTPGGPASPATVDLTQDAAGWPLAQVAAHGRAVQVEDVRSRFPGLVCGPYPEPVKSALVQTIMPPGYERPACIMVAGVSTRLPMNEAYRSFYDLLTAAVTTVIANAMAYEAERQRAEALAEIDRAKTAFFSNVSHEFRTPLTLLLGPVEDELAEHGDALPPRRRERLEIVHRNSLRLLKLVNTLLDFARIEAGRVQAVYEPADLATLTADLAGNFRSACERAGLWFSVDCLPLPEPVYVDHDLWEKIVLNLLSNAFKFTLAGGIGVSLKPAAGETVELAVRDTGTGIPADELPRVFERFHRVKGAQGRTHEGTGIGLALVRELAALHGGSIRAESVLEQGSTFTVSLPFGKAHLPAEQIGAARTLASTALGAGPFVEEALRWLPAAATLPPAEAEEQLRPEHVPATTAELSPPRPADEHATGQQPRIVWADDNADMRDYVLRLLGQRYTVEAVTNGEEALAAVRRELPDLVLSDVMMPRLDGFGLLRALRSDERTRTVPVILLSARAGEESRIEGLAVGADDYLVKPFSTRELLARVETHVVLARLRRETEAARRAVEKAEVLQASEAQLRLVTDAVPALISYIDSNQRYRFNNRAYEEWFGHPRAEVYGKHLEEVLGTAAYQTISQHVETALTGQSVTYETVVPYKDGGVRFIQAAYVPDIGADGGIKGLFALVSDITKRKQAEEALRLSEERLASILSSLLDGVITVDERQCITLLNPAVERLFGCRAADLLGQPLDRLIPERFRATHAAHIHAFGQSNVTRRKMGELTSVYGLRTDGEEFPIEAAISQTEVAGQKLFTVMLRDITERQRAEEALTKRTEELARSNQDLEQFAYVASHDLQEPLRAVAGCVQLLQKRYQGKIDERADEFITHAVEGAERMRQLIDDLLAFSRVGTRGGQLQPVDSGAALAAALANLTVAVHESGAVVTHDPLPTVTADPTQLTLLLQNLISNAIKFRRERSPRIHVGAQHQDNHWVLSVCDNGIGIEPQYFERIFGIFQRLHTRREYAGTGMGLAICKKIVERHGGRIWVESVHGAGCTFYCSLPDGQ